MIGLLMMVRDEKPVVGRAINSVKILIDKYITSDTGSIDGTPEIIQKELKDISGQLLFHDWINYGVNRSYLMEEAYGNLNTKYLLLLDADEVLERPDGSPLTQEDREKLLGFIESHPEANLFTMTTYYDCEYPIKYPRYQILRNNQLYRWELPYHEELVCTTDASVVHIDFIVNRARKEGYNSRNPDKLQTHVNEYLNWLIDHPNHPRATFYLARTYHDLDDYQNAIIWYQKRLDLGFSVGRKAEIYVSLISLARIYMSRKQFSQAEDKLKEGIQLFPSRLEFYYELMVLYSDFLRQYSKALIFGQNINLSMPINDSWVEIDIYEWKFKFKLAMVALHDKKKELAETLLRELLQENKIPSRDIPLIKTLLPNNSTKKRINITSYVGANAAFKEFVLLLQDTLSEMDYSYINTREIDPNRLNIVVGSAHTPDYYLKQKLPPDTILVNLEQLYDGCPWDNGIYGNSYVTLLSKYRVWDYSKTNIKWLAKRGIKAELFRKLYTPIFETVKQLPEKQKDIDVLFYGDSIGERKVIMDTLQTLLPHKNICFHNNIWGSQKDDYISRSRIVLNIHGYPSNIFESSRVCHLLSNKVFVISEKSVDDEDYTELDEGLIRVLREEIVETVAKYLELPEERQKISEKGYQAVKNLKYTIPDLKN